MSCQALVEKKITPAPKLTSAAEAAAKTVLERAARRLLMERCPCASPASLYSSTAMRDKNP